jgi:hypothetical protein
MKPKSCYISGYFLQSYTGILYKNKMAGWDKRTNGKSKFSTLPSNPFMEKLHIVPLNHDPTHLPGCLFMTIHLSHHSLHKHLLSIPHYKYGAKSSDDKDIILALKRLPVTTRGSYTGPQVIIEFRL